MGKRGPKPGTGGRPRKAAGDNLARSGDGYKRRTVGPKSKGTQVYEHRAKAGLGATKGSKGKGTVVDHKNRNTSDNRASNLRKTTKAGNARNRKHTA